MYVWSSYKDTHQWNYKAVGRAVPCRCISNHGVVELVLQECYIRHRVLQNHMCISVH